MAKKSKGVYEYQAIVHEGERQRWVMLTGKSFTLVDKFTADCILSIDAAKGFMRKPGLDERYRKVTITCEVPIV